MSGLTTFLLPPDTRMDGQGNPPADINSVVDAITALGALYNVLNAANAGGGDTSGGADCTAAINAAAAAGVALLPPGTFLINGSTPLAGAVKGAGFGLTTIKVGSSFTGTAAISQTSPSYEISDLAIVGADSGNSALGGTQAWNGIEVTGAARGRVRNVWFQYVNGWQIEAVSGSSATNVDTQLTGIFGRNNAGGIHLLGSTGTSFLGEYFLTDIQAQQMGTATGPSANLDGLLVEDVGDVLVQGINVGFAASQTGRAIAVKGACATVRIRNGDVGSNAIAAGSGGQPAIHILSSTNGSPADVTVDASAEGGAVACQVDAGTAIRLYGRLHQAYGTGLAVNGTSEVLALGVQFAANNQGNITAYDIDHSGMTGGNFRAVACELETSIGSGAGLVPQSVNTNFRGYFKACFFVATGSAPSNVFNGTAQQVTDCVGYNPRGSVTAPSVGTSPYTPGTYQAPLMVVFTAINGMTQYAIGGVAVPLPVAGVPFPLGARQSHTVTWATTAPTWQWFGL